VAPWQGGEEEELIILNFGLLENCRKIFLSEKFSSKDAKLRAKNKRAHF